MHSRFIGQPQQSNSKFKMQNSKRLRSPYDREARRSRKNSLSWTGYKVHFSETCDEELPRLITHIETSAATTQVKRLHPSFMLL